jgi:hypothetical protein
MEIKKYSERLRSKTKELLKEIYLRSKLKWPSLLIHLELENPGLVHGISHMRQLGSGKRYLTDAKLAVIGNWAIEKGWGGTKAKLAIKYKPPTQRQLLAAKRENRHLLYLLKDPFKRLVTVPTKIAEEEKGRAEKKLGEALSKMLPAGFSSSETLYMVYAWLIKNSSNWQRGTKERNLVFYMSEFDQKTFNQPIFPELFSKEFSIAEHCDGSIYFIKCEVSPLSFEGETIWSANKQEDAE